MLAAQMRGLADAILTPVSVATGIPAPAVQAIVEGTTTGAVAAGRATRGRKRSAYMRKYKAAFKRQASQYKRKNGTWKKDGFKRAVRAAHKEARK